MWHCLGFMWLIEMLCNISLLLPQGKSLYSRINLQVLVLAVGPQVLVLRPQVLVLGPQSPRKLSRTSHSANSQLPPPCMTIW